MLPAFGQRLMKRRFAGWHPLYVSVVYGEDWSVFNEEPFTAETAWLAVRPRDYKPGTIDFRCLAGAAVTVFDQERAAGEEHPFFNLLREVAEWSGPLELVTAAEIYSPAPSKPPFRVAAHRYAFECKLADPARAWPWWWPESLDMKHGEKISAWCAAARSRGGAATGGRRAA